MATAPYFTYFGSDNSVEVGPNLRLANLAPSQGGRFASVFTVTAGFTGGPTLPATILWSRLGNVVHCSLSLGAATGGGPLSCSGSFTLPVARVSPFSADPATLAQQCAGTGAFGNSGPAGGIIGLTGSASSATIAFALHPGSAGAFLLADFKYYIE